MSIAGEWCDAEDGNTAEILNPATGEVMATTPKATLSDVNRCVEASRAAFEDSSWKNMDPAQRGRILNKMAQATYAKAKELAAIESNNNGKTFREALSEIRYGAWTLEYFAGLSDKIEGSTIPVPGNRLNYTLRQPLGVTVHIIPWNFPLQLAIRSIAPALGSRLYCDRKTSIMDTTLFACMGQSNGRSRSWTPIRSFPSHYWLRWTDW